jgi:hypothetical protein
VGWFKKKPRIDQGNIGFDERPGTFKTQYVEFPLPDPGAMNFIPESLALPAIQPIGTGQLVAKPFTAFSGELLYYVQAQYLSGMPGQITGGLKLQPLFDPGVGFVSQNLEAPINVDL